MYGGLRLCFLILMTFVYIRQSYAQQLTPFPSKPGNIHLDVIVTANSGAPVSGLEEQDFTVKDDGTPQNITSFLAVSSVSATEVVIVLDAVNASSREVVAERQEIEKFLKADGDPLAHQTVVAILTEKGLAFAEKSSSDGNAISAELQKRIGPGSIGRRADQLPAELFRLSVAGLTQLIAKERDDPGRKAVIWVSPGWPTLSAVRESRQREVDKTVVDLVRPLHESRITLYSVVPSGQATLADGKGQTASERERSDQSVGDAVPTGNATNSSDSGWRSLALPALARQSGGLALSAGEDANDSIAARIKECVADAAAFYEISFVPPVSGQPDQYHRLEVGVTNPGLRARTRSGYYEQAPHASFFVVDPNSPNKAATDFSSYSNARPYLDRPLQEMIAVVPDLKNVQPAPDQQQLAMILGNLGRSVDEFMRDIGDLIAHEDIAQEKLDAKGKVHANERVQDNYLILSHGNEWGARAEYRMDDSGNRLGAVGLAKGFLVTSGFALSCIRFATTAQPQSRFRYLGDEKLGGRDTYVVGFAQNPGKNAFSTALRGADGRDVEVLTQGVLWVDKNQFQIVHMWTGLLAANAALQLDQMTNEVTFAEVKLPGASHPLWLPSDVQVSIDINHKKYRNIHHYTDYRRYRVSSRLVAPE